MQTATDALGELQQASRTTRSAMILKRFLALLRFERGLLEKFRRCFRLLWIQRIRGAARLRSDSNRCAHPTFLKNSAPYNPSAELARLHIRNALALVLSQHPRQGRAALSSLEAIVLSSYFPKKLADAVERLRGYGTTSARPALDRCLRGRALLRLAEPGTRISRKLAAAKALEATVEIHRAQALPAIDPQH